MAPSAQEPPTYSQFACIGTGFSGIALGAQLQRWYGITDIRFFEQQTSLGGTWHINRYPGAACDIPSALYSLSFETNPNWTRVMPAQEELFKYLKRVSDKYNLTDKMSFNTTVTRCEWVPQTSRWRIHTRDAKTGATLRLHEAQFLFSGAGLFNSPRDAGVPGAESFNGRIVHSGRWPTDDSFTLENKNVVVFGNGCTGSQIVPAIVGQTKHTTQIIRSRHWVMPPLDRVMTPALRAILTWVPGTMLLQRFFIFCLIENHWRGFYMTEAGARFRKKYEAICTQYFKATAPEKYHDMLIPDWSIGCKRRVFDCGYLESLHAENLTLTDEPADVIVLATGFDSNRYLGGVEVVGREGETLEEHWERAGGAGAYNASCLSGFPNFFLLMGPNSSTGHNSVVLATENMVNYALRVLKPLLEGKGATAEVKPDAEQTYVSDIQDGLKNTVFLKGGCASWYNRGTDAEGKKTWNASTYPYSQEYFWYRCLFPVWDDWVYGGKQTKSTIAKRQTGLLWVVTPLLLVAAGLFWLNATGGSKVEIPFVSDLAKSLKLKI
ncbi:hypothetical protein B0T17DRAFT_621331 [Bombardia bombarda]|uniref:Uncharacterized protein n=1 Tax=Bombardia bombarda TaxID=252184 RepID=A0AA39U1V6_9PEZI|nr:hypothetical protein B0T17DRAFT_621331 [Bombardia bombarda]